MKVVLGVMLLIIGAVFLVAPFDHYDVFSEIKKYVTKVKG
jgi:hypothetical protein